MEGHCAPEQLEAAVQLVQHNMSQSKLFFKLSIECEKHTSKTSTPNSKAKENRHSGGTFPTLQFRFKDISRCLPTSNSFGAQFLRSFVAQRFASPHFHGGLRMCQIGSLLEL